MSEQNNHEPDPLLNVDAVIGANPKAFLASVARQSMETIAVCTAIPLPLLERAAKMQREDVLNMNAQDTADVYAAIVEFRKKIVDINAKRELRLQQ